VLQALGFFGRDFRPFLPDLNPPKEDRLSKRKLSSQTIHTYRGPGIWNKFCDPLADGDAVVATITHKVSRRSLLFPSVETYVRFAKEKKRFLGNLLRGLGKVDETPKIPREGLLLVREFGFQISLTRTFKDCVGIPNTVFV
jgi:hypothetical protein